MEAQQSHAPQVDTRPIETGEPENYPVEALEIDERETPRPEPAETATPGKDATRAIEIRASVIEVQGAEADAAEAQGQRAYAEEVQNLDAQVTESSLEEDETQAGGHSRTDDARVCSRHLAVARRNRRSHGIRGSIHLRAITASAQSASRRTPRREEEARIGPHRRRGQAKDWRCATRAGHLGISRPAACVTFSCAKNAFMPKLFSRSTRLLLAPQALAVAGRCGARQPQERGAERLSPRSALAYGRREEPRLPNRGATSRGR